MHNRFTLADAAEIARPPHFLAPGYDMRADLAALGAQLHALNGGNWLVGMQPGGPGLIEIANSYPGARIGEDR